MFRTARGLMAVAGIALLAGCPPPGGDDDDSATDAGNTSSSSSGGTVSSSSASAGSSQGGSSGASGGVSLDSSAGATSAVATSSLASSAGTGSSADGSSMGASGSSAAPVSSSSAFTSSSAAPLVVARPDTYTATEDRQLTRNAALGVLVNDTAPTSMLPLTAVLETSVSHGTLVLQAGGGFTYTPAANYSGPDSFTYHARGGGVDSYPATVTITVNPSNDLPQPLPDQYTLVEDTVLAVNAANGVLSNDGDPDPADTLTVTVANNGDPLHGVLVLDLNGSFTFLPAADYAGTDTFTYTVTDGTASGSETVTLTITPVNDAPRAAANTYSPTRNVTLTVAAPGVLGNDVEVDGETMTAVLVANPAHGSLSLNGDGSFTFIPETGYIGADTFTYLARDVLGTDSAVTTVTFNIGATNLPPSAVADSYPAFDEDTTLTVAPPGVLANDQDPEGSTLTPTVTTPPTRGTLTLNANGGFDYIPNLNENGTDSFQYRVADETSTSAPVTVDLTISPVNDAPVAVDDPYTTDEDTTLSVLVDSGVRSNDTDVDHATSALTITLGGTLPTLGTVTLNADGSFDYVPAADVVGTDTFSYVISDGTLTDTGTVTITINAVEDAPVAQADTYNATEDTVLTVNAASGVLSNDSDVDLGAVLTAVLAVDLDPGMGTLALAADGSFVYTPAANFNGTATFQYRANDGLLDSSSVTVSIDVAPVNDAPEAVNDDYTATEDTTLTVTVGVTLNDTDAENDGLTATQVVGPLHGTLSLAATGAFIYTPAANYNGPDSFTYRLTDDGTPNQTSNTATVNISVSAVNDAPVANDDAYTTNEDTTLTRTPATNGVGANDTDVENNPLTFAVVTNVANGTLTFNADGTFTYLPRANFNGTDSFTYRVTDSGGALSGNATVTLTVTAVNDPPTLTNDGHTTQEDVPLVVGVLQGLMANDSDMEGNTFTVAVDTSPAHGTLALNANGSFTFTPTANYYGLDSFTYRATDTGTPPASSTATVYLTITAVNDQPAALNDSYSTPEDTLLTVTPATSGVRNNDTDIETATTALTCTLLSTTTKGTLTFNSDGTFTYLPNANFNGSDSFTYRVSDDGTPQGVSAAATVTITVTPVNDAPTVLNDNYATTEGTVLNVPAPGVKNNDSDIDGDAFNVAVFSQPTAGTGTVTVNPDGSFQYTPPALYNGTTSFQYRATDTGGLFTNGTVTLSVGAVNNPPTAVDDGVYSVTEDTALVVPEATGVKTNDTDPDSNMALATVAVVTAPSHGTVTLVAATGGFTYTPVANYNGADSFTYRTTDTGGAPSSPATVRLDVVAVNDAPVAVNDPSYSTNEDTPLVVAEAAGVKVNDTDVEGNTLTFAVISPPAASAGSVVLNATTGGFTFTPVANYNGTATFTYRATDNGTPNQQSNVATVTITVVSVNDPPTVVLDGYTVAEDATLTLAAPGVGSNDSDVEGHTFTFTRVGNTTNGTLTFNVNGSFTYVPNANFNGADSFTYFATDSLGATSLTQTVNISVTAVNDAPILDNDGPYAATEDTPLTVPAASGVKVGDSDIEGDSFTVAVVTSPAHGSVVLTPATGAFTYTPAANWFGPDSFTYRATDSGGAVSANATVTLTVAGTPDNPVAVQDGPYAAVAGFELLLAAPGVLSNDTDPDVTYTLTAALNTAPASGAFTLAPDGTVSYTPLTTQSGTVTFSYHVVDDTALSSNIITVSINVTPNQVPASQQDSYTPQQDTLLTVAAPGVLTNDSDGDGHTLTTVDLVAPLHGSVTLNANGSFSYTSNPLYAGYDVFTYRATDSVDKSPVTSVNLTVRPRDIVVGSVTATGLAGNGHSTGNRVGLSNTLTAVFSSAATNLVSPDPSGINEDVFIKNMRTLGASPGSVVRRGASTTVGSRTTSNPAVSADGRYVVLQSQFGLLAPDTNEPTQDVYLYNASTGVLTLLSKTAAGNGGNGDSTCPAISPNGKYIAFVSAASDLEGVVDTNGFADVIALDRELAIPVLTLASVETSGLQATAGSLCPVSVSNDGKVAFGTAAPLDPVMDTAGMVDVYVHDLVTLDTTRATRDNAGGDPSQDCKEPAISGDGNVVVFQSTATDLLSAASDSVQDVYAVTFPGLVNSRVSVRAATGGEPNGVSRNASVSQDGRYVAFMSSATDIVTGDTNNAEDAFVRDRTSTTTPISVRRANVTSAGAQGPGTGGTAAVIALAISPDGHHVLFNTADVLTTGDANGVTDTLMAPNPVFVLTGP